MSMNSSDILSYFNTVLQKKGYDTIRPAAQAPTTDFDALLDDASASAAKREFYSHPRLGTEADGKPVMGQTEEEMTDAIKELTEWAVARGQDADNLHFILGNTPVFDGPTGPMLGYAMRAAVELPMPPKAQMEKTTLAKLLSS
ncbi:hypothetical protein K9F62_20415 [Desulfovibrio sp. JY]|nr:hypothetical protein K9F62_20415 [Desulfovibrio sp. JY]